MSSKWAGVGPTLTDLKYAYYAAFIDGEGCIRANGGITGHSATVDVANTYLPILNMFKNEFGGEVSSRKPKYGHKPMYHWRCWGDKARGTLQLLLPFLVEKKPQAELLLTLQDTSFGSPERDAIIAELARLKRVQHV